MDEKEPQENEKEQKAPVEPKIPERFKIKPDAGISYEIGSKEKEPPPKPLTQTPRSIGQLPRIRTYSSDMSGAIKKRGETLASIVNKEQSSNQKRFLSEAEKAIKTRRLVVISLISILVLSGLFAVIGAVFFSQKKDAVVVPEKGIIFANQTKQIILRDSGSLSSELLSLRESQNLSLGEIMRVEVIKNNVLLTGSELALELGISSSLAREITGSMIGIHSFDRNQPFIIFEVVAYDRAFGSLLNWERTAGRDLGDFFSPTGATSSAPLLRFEDKIVRNLDVRTSGKEWPILYTFPERKMLVMTTNEYTLQEILTRLQSTLR